MKERYFLIGILVPLLLAFLYGFVNLTESFPGANTSGELTSNAAASSTKGFLTGVHVISNGSNDPTVLLWDSADTQSGTKLAEFTLDVSVGPVAQYYAMGIPVRYTNGIFVGLSGTGASAIVEYTER